MFSRILLRETTEFVRRNDLMSSLGEGGEAPGGCVGWHQGFSVRQRTGIWIRQGPIQDGGEKQREERMQCVPQRGPLTPPVTTVFDSDLLMEIHEGTEG